MKINADAPVPTIATQPLKLLWSTPRVVLLASELGTHGKGVTPVPTEIDSYTTTFAVRSYGPS
jgi:hypothetical protein